MAICATDDQTTPISSALQMSARRRHSTPPVPETPLWREAKLSLLRSKGAAQDFFNADFWATFTLPGKWD